VQRIAVDANVVVEDQSDQPEYSMVEHLMETENTPVHSLAEKIHFHYEAVEG
jgi:hypothetical protein